MNMIWTLDASKLKILATHALPVSEYMESWDRPASVKGSILMRQLENQIAVLLHRMMARLFWYFQTRALKWTECRSIDINCRHVTQTWWQEHWTNAKQEQDTKCRQSDFGDIYTHTQTMHAKENSSGEVGSMDDSTRQGHSVETNSQWKMYFVDEWMPWCR